MHFQGSFSSKQPQLGTTIFAKMSALAQQHNAINLSQGFPDFPVHPYLIELVNGYMKAGMNQYAPLGGVPKLTQVLAEKMERLYGAQYNPASEITVTAGGTQALASAIAATVREGDEVMIFTPAYDSYAPVVQLHGGTPVFVQLKHPNYAVDWNEVKSRINRKTKLIIINSPHNPTGTVWSRADLEQLANLIDNTNIMVLSDEVYEHITFDGLPHVSVAAIPKLAERSFAVFSFGKTFHATGWKLGYILAPENLMKEFRKVHQYDVFCCNAPMQYALADYLQNPEVYQINQMYQAKRDFFQQQMQGGKFVPIASAGTYFQLYDYSQISEESDTVFAERLVTEFGVAAIPVSVFYHVPTDHKVLRFCFAKQDATLAAAAEILKKL